MMGFSDTVPIRPVLVKGTRSGSLIGNLLACGLGQSVEVSSEVHRRLSTSIVLLLSPQHHC